MYIYLLLYIIALEYMESARINDTLTEDILLIIFYY